MQSCSSMKCGILEPNYARDPRGMHEHLQSPAAMERYAGRLDDLAPMVDADVHRHVVLEAGDAEVAQSCRIAQGGTSTRPEQRCPELRLLWQRAGEPDEDAGIDALPATSYELSGDGVGGETRYERLTSREGTALAAQQWGVDGDLVVHLCTVLALGRSWALARVGCGYRDPPGAGVDNLRHPSTAQGWGKAAGLRPGKSSPNLGGMCQRDLESGQAQS